MNLLQVRKLVFFYLNFITGHYYCSGGKSYFNLTRKVTFPRLHQHPQVTVGPNLLVDGVPVRDVLFGPIGESA